MKKYWQNIEEINKSAEKANDKKQKNIKNDDLTGFLEELPLNAFTSRRDFLKFIGFGVSSAVIASACQKPVQKAIPFLNQPADIIPGKASHFASSFFDGSEYCPIVVKVRDGRPIKIEGNDIYKYTQGGTTARVQASILSLYDNARIKSPLKKSIAISWADADKEIISELKKTLSNSKKIALLTTTIFSPSTLKAIDNFKLKYPNLKVVYYDVFSYSGILDAYKEFTGKAIIPYPQFDKAKVIVNFGADFLGTWLLPAEFTLAYASMRKVGKGLKNMSRHIQFESNMSLTGSNADERIQIKPSEELAILYALYNILSGKPDKEMERVLPLNNSLNLNSIADELLEYKGNSIVLSGSNDITVQKTVIAINNILDNYGKTLNIDKPILIKQGTDKEMFNLISEMKNGQIGALLLNNVNPVYDYYESSELISAIREVDLKIAFSIFPNETLPYCDFVCPDHHFLESWNDYEPRTGIYSISQPCINPLFNTRQMQESLLIWSGKSIKWEDYVVDHWAKVIFSEQHENKNFNSFWTDTLRNGIFETSVTKKLNISRSWKMEDLKSKIKTSDSFELLLTVPVSISSGFHANNPWLQELPDPVSRVTWDNYASVSPKLAHELNLKTGDVISINNKLEIPVLIQPGVVYGAICIALNYGRKNAGKVADSVGVNLFPFLVKSDENLSYFQTGIKIIKTKGFMQLAQMQTHDSMEGREIVRETTLTEYIKKPNSGNEMHEEFEKTHQTLYPEFKYGNFHWAMGVDLNLCTGCGACVIACQAENNIAVVGKEQVIKRRIMHWIRIDRYYTGSSDSPSVLFQPVMCQQCDNAPCENVCPVAATNHSNEGLNQMAYNRCVGTRYCMNNCPYKVRRFNWFKFVDNPKFDYNQNSKLGKLVLNPDVVVRERGVVEKCSFCVQRIQEAKLNAKLENRELKDGEILPACVQACPAKALTFGDLNDNNKRMSEWFSDERDYHLLEELHTLPKVGYLTKVRNRK